MKSPTKSPRRTYRERKPPRQHSAEVQSEDNVTDPVAGQEDWSIENLPEILYQFRRDSSQSQVRRDLNIPTKPSPWRNSPKLRVFDILPDRVSSNVEEFRVEAWMRLDRRIQLHDITDRMNPIFRVENNALQQRGVRFRKAFSLLAWGTGNRKTEQMEQILEKKMIERGIDPRNNSTRGLTPGLIDPLAGEAGGRIPIPEPYYTRYLHSGGAGAGAAVAGAGIVARRVSPRRSAKTVACTTASSRSRSSRSSRSISSRSRRRRGSDDTDTARRSTERKHEHEPVGSGLTMARAQSSFMSESSGYDSGSFEDEFQLSLMGTQLDYEHPAARFCFGGHHSHYSSFDLKSPLDVDDTFDPTLDYDTTPPDTLAVHSYNGLPSFSQSQSLSASTPDVGSSFSSEPDDEQLMFYPSSYLADLSMHHHHRQQAQAQAQAQALSSSLDHKIPMGTETLPWDNLSPDSPPAQQPLWPLVDASLPELHLRPTASYLPPAMPGEAWMQVQRAQLGGEVDGKGFFQEQYSDGLEEGGVSF